MPPYSHNGVPAFGGRAFVTLTHERFLVSKSLIRPRSHSSLKTGRIDGNFGHVEPGEMQGPGPCLYSPASEHHRTLALYSGHVCLHVR